MNLIEALEAANAKSAKLFRKAAKSGKKADFDAYLLAYADAKKAYRVRWAAEDAIKSNSVIA